MLRLMFNRITLSLCVGLVIGTIVGSTITGMLVVYHEQVERERVRDKEPVLNAEPRPTRYGLWFNMIKP
jgi:hypothetical protein